MDRSIVLGAKCPICGFHIGGGPVLENAIGAAWQLLEKSKELREVQQHENKSD